MRDAVCIIGMHRSGTSMIARLLKLCGLVLGTDDQLVGPDVGNVEGHFEHVGFVRINNAILAHFGGSGASPPPLKTGWEMDPGITRLAGEAKLLVEGFRNYRRWGWKDPRTTLLLAFWKKIVPQMRYVICVRSPLDVARSLEMRDCIPVQEGALLWSRYTTVAISETEGHPRIFTFYDDFFREPLREIKRLLDFCGLALPTDPTTILDAVSKPLRHHVSTSMDLLTEEKILLAHKLYYLSLRALNLPQLAGSQDVEKTSGACGKLAALLDELHSTSKLTQLQSTLAEQDLALKHLVQENRTLKLSLDGMARSLTWQLSNKLEKYKERFLPGGTGLRKLYDRILVRMKKLSFFDLRA